MKDSMSLGLRACLVCGVFWLLTVCQSTLFFATTVYGAGNTDHQQCIRAINFYEKRYQLPQGLLYAITVVESGKWNKDTNGLEPHPWTLNVNGKPYYFNTKAEALEFFRRSLAAGIENIDVGCGQVNWRYHGKEYFRVPANALNPNYSVAYSAYFLAKNFAATGNWKDAVAMYHSRHQHKGREYYAKVEKVLNAVAKSTSKLPGKQRTRHTVVVCGDSQAVNNRNNLALVASRLKSISSAKHQDNIMVFAKRGENNPSLTAVEVIQ